MNSWQCLANVCIAKSTEKEKNFINFIFMNMLNNTVYSCWTNSSTQYYL